MQTDESFAQLWGFFAQVFPQRRLILERFDDFLGLSLGKIGREAKNALANVFGERDIFRREVVDLIGIWAWIEKRVVPAADEEAHRGEQGIGGICLGWSVENDRIS